MPELTVNTFKWMKFKLFNHLSKIWKRQKSPVNNQATNVGSHLNMETRVQIIYHLPNEKYPFLVTTKLTKHNGINLSEFKLLVHEKGDYRYIFMEYILSEQFELLSEINDNKQILPFYKTDSKIIVCFLLTIS